MVHQVVIGDLNVLVVINASPLGFSFILLWSCGLLGAKSFDLARRIAQFFRALSGPLDIVARSASC